MDLSADRPPRYRLLPSASRAQEDEDVMVSALFDLADAYSDFLSASFDSTLDCIGYIQVLCRSGPRRVADASCSVGDL